MGRPGRSPIGFREGFLVVAVTWLVAATLGALPYLFSGEAQLDRPIDAYFEAMSGFTTTGASVLTDIPALDQSMLMWRQFTQWLGGMGIIVLALAVLPRLRVGGRQLLESEMPGPEIDDLANRIRSTAQRLWLLYVALTAAQAAILAVFGWTGIDDRMDPFNAVAHAFTTLPTGGFSPEARSVEAFTAASQWVIVVFMVLAGMNFALLYRAIVRRRPRAVARDEEARLYLTILASCPRCSRSSSGRRGSMPARPHSGRRVPGRLDDDDDRLREHGLRRLARFRVDDPDRRDVRRRLGRLDRRRDQGRPAPPARKVLRRELRQTLHPEAVMPIRLNGAVVDERTLRAITAFVLLYVGLFAVGAGLIALDAAFQGPPISALDAIAATATTLGNVGPGLGFAGPMGSFEPFSDFSTGVMIALMWLGRLEIIPIVVLLTRGYWRV